MTGLTVLCVDPDEDSRVATRETLETEGGYETVGVASVAAAADALDNPIDCVVSEYALPDGTGLDVTARVRERAPDTPCVLFTDVPPAKIDTADHGDVVVEYLPRGTPDARSSLVRLVGNVVAEHSQVGYPLPTAENERLAALEQYDLPGLTTEEAFDRLTTLARRHFDVDVAFLGLIDAHEERFVACRGADWETLPREKSICTHTILGDEVLVVEDTHADPRFVDNDRLDELDIRSYAGVPLTTPEGVAIGAFCLTDDEPRSFEEAELTDLRRFADEAMGQLELRRRLADARRDGSTDSSGDPTGGDDA